MNYSSRDAIAGSASLLLLFLALAGGAPAANAMDKARAETRTAEAIEVFGADGEGVIVAVLDRGIDWKNDDFRNEDGTTRIKYIFDLSDDGGANAPGNSYGRGTIYTESQINAALSGGPDLPTRDAVGHGSTTAGIAAGNGRNSDGKYRGIAPKASLIVVKVTSEGAPAHDDQPAEAPFGGTAINEAGMQFAVDKAAELGMPMVAILNLGSNGGPTDGTSRISRSIDSLFGSGKPGLVFVNGPGDEGGGDNRASATVQPGQTVTLDIEKGTAGTLRVDLWYPTDGAGEAGLTFAVRTPASGTFGPYPSVTAETQRDSRSQPGVFNYTHNGRDVDFYESTSQKRELLIDFTGAVGSYALEITRPAGAGTAKTFVAVLNFASFSSDANGFRSHVIPGNVWDGATAFNNISPTNYNLSHNWTDIDGVARSVADAGHGAIGDIWAGSSVGPTVDGRLGIDVAAPGQHVMTVYAPDSHWATFDFNKVQDGDGFYGRAGAVSAAAPMTTGIIALMLQANPELDAIEARQILRDTARGDASTGAVPNASWGYGKVDAFKAVQRALALIATPNAVIVVRGSDPQITFESIQGVSYRIEYKDDLDDAQWSDLVEGLAGQAGTTTFTDTTLGAEDSRFYRVAAE